MTGSTLLFTAALGIVAPAARFENEAPRAQPHPDEASASTSTRVRDDWMLSLEAVTRVPIDAGGQIGFETPFGLRLFGGYGWVPYVDVLTGIVVSSSDRRTVSAPSLSAAC